MATYAGKLNVGGTTIPIGSTLYGTCSTGASTAAKVVTCDNFDKLLTGVTIHVKFTYSNTNSSPTLNVNSTGAKNIYRYGTTKPGTTAKTSWQAGAVVSFTYDGSYWQMNDWLNDDTTYTASSTTPSMDGTGTVGTSTDYARADHVHPSDTSRVPTSRTINSKALSSDITLSASDVGAVPTSRTVNGKALSSNITLSASDVSAIASSLKGAASGVAELDANGLVPTSQLPSYVDDVLEYSAKSSFPTTGETGKIYVDTTTNLSYRWSGTAYVEISSSLALGTTSSTAFRGDYGNAAYAHAVTNKGSAFSSGLYKITTNSEGHITAATAVVKADITGLGIPGSDTNNAVTQTATTTSANYEVLFSSSADNTTKTEGARKNDNLLFNPSTGNLQATQLNGVTIGSSPKFSDTTYSAGTGLSLSSTTFNHSNSVTGGTVGTSSATSGSTLDVPYVTYDDQGHVTASGTHTHTVSGFLTSHQTIKQDGVTGATVTRFGTCSTAAGTAAKTVSVTAGTFALETGARVTVKFSNANTAGTPTLNVNSKGAKNIFHNGAQITTGGNKALLAGTCDFVYDGTQWHLIGNYVDTNDNTTYTFANGTNGFTVTPSGGSAQTVTVTPSITNNVTGSGTSGYIAKFNGTNTITSGPQLGSGTTTYLRNDGSWATPTNTTYSAGTGLSLSSTTFNHSNSVTAGTVGTSSATSGNSIAVPYVTYDAQGHITATGTHTHTATVPPSGVVMGNDAQSGGLDPVTAAYIPTAASNKSFGLPAAAITIEYSTNAGSTWTSYGATDAEKRNLFNESRGTGFYLGKATAKANNTVNNRLRVTIEPTDRYCSFHGIYVWFNTQGNTCLMDLERSTIGAKDTFSTVFTGQAVSGWSGNNIRYFTYGTFGGGSTQTSNQYKYRITFRQTAVNTNYPSAIVYDIRFLGYNLWTAPTDAYARNMLYNHVPFSTDASGNVTFPAEITATDFNGTVNGFSIAASVPSGATFTDTTYTFASGTNGFTVTPSGGSAQTITVTPSISYTYNATTEALTLS